MYVVCGFVFITKPLPTYSSRLYSTCLPCLVCRYGEIININLVRDKSGKSKGFCFLGYENQKSTVLAVDNFNGIKVHVGVM